MNEQTIVFFCGPDRCGKTQIAKELSRRLNVPYFKASSERDTFLSSRVERSERFMYQLRYADPRVFDLLSQTGHSVVFDRGFPCEYAYSQVLKRKSDLELLYKMDEAWASIGAKVVFCYRSSYDNIVDDLDSTIDSTVLKALDEKYREFFARSKCDHVYLNVDDEDLEREIREVVKFVNNVGEER